MGGIGKGPRYVENEGKWEVKLSTKFFYFEQMSEHKEQSLQSFIMGTLTFCYQFLFRG